MTITWSICAALALFLAGIGWAAEESVGLSLLGVLLGAPILAMAALITGIGYRQFGLMRQWARQRDRDDAEVEQFLQRLRLLESSGSSLHSALDRALPKDMRQHGDRDLADVMAHTAKRWPVPALKRGLKAWDIAARHGGRIDLLADQVLSQLQADRRLRWELQASLAGSLGTMIVLGLAPWLVVMIFKLAFSGFYKVLTTELMGQISLILVAVITAGVMAIAARESRHYD